MGRPKTSYSRGELIAICESAIVPQAKWRDRDSESAHCQLGKCWALLRAGCEFQVLYEPNSRSGLSTDDLTIWVETLSEGFDYFESWAMPGDAAARRADLRRETHYLPTPKRLKNAAGEDWY
ncbi:hypothetical protein ACWPMX_07905 [Tsuneonella sp. HG094]